ncbi:hypothetical protein DFH08DRAFT_715080 [Mycena albidolilacea]|uniref:Uncharacterized protein n=1 Tax=Mycena albidolilacea TaxID=1033008 RepID=A0AAD6ZE30_9AGAR|nr:hypothetical protein DFH08DRAFT_715080 [Mycena albidolilacea]
MDSVVPSDLAASLGALQIGVFVSHVLFGVTTTQTYIYYSRFPEDSQKIKVLVLYSFIKRVCEFAHAICIGHAIYTYTISNYGHPERIAGALPKPLLAAAFLTAVIATLVQGFFTIRVYALSKRLYVALIVSAVIFVRLLGTIAIVAIGMRMTLLKSFERQWGWIFTVSWSISSASDLTITAILVAFLRKQRLGVCKRTTALVDKIITWTIGLPMNCSGHVIFSDESCCRDGVNNQVGFPSLPFPQLCLVSYLQHLEHSRISLCMFH